MPLCWGRSSITCFIFFRNGLETGRQSAAEKAYFGAGVHVPATLALRQPAQWKKRNASWRYFELAQPTSTHTPADSSISCRHLNSYSFHAITLNTCIDLLGNVTCMPCIILLEGAIHFITNVSLRHNKEHDMSSFYGARDTRHTLTVMCRYSFA